MNIGTLVLSLIISIGAFYLAWMCYPKNDARRFIISLFAFFFSGLYILYHFIVHVALGYDCEVKATKSKKKKQKK